MSESVETRSAAEFFAEIEREVKLPLHLTGEDLVTEQAERIAAAVFAAVERLISPKEIGDVASQLPRDLQSLWRDAAVQAPA
jgi:uncharacterized protein (DUF2267 family)